MGGISFLCSKQNRNRRSFARFAVHSNLSVVILHSVLYDRKAKASAAGLFGVALIHTIEALEYFILVFGRNADTSILHTQQNFTGFLRNGYFHAATGIVVLNGIVTKIVNDLVQ